MTTSDKNLLSHDQWGGIWNNSDIKGIPLDFSSCLYSHYYGQFLTYDDTKTVIEIGAFPGQYLGYVAKNFGHRPTALDFIDDFEFMERNMRANGLRCEMINADFLSWIPPHRYDVVLSHGFVEHFRNYEEVVEKHFDLVAPGGFLFLSVPAASRTRLLYNYLRGGRKGYDRFAKSHVFEVMHLKRLKEIASRDASFDILFAGRNRRLRPPPRKRFRFIRRILEPVLTPSIMIVARKKPDRIETPWSEPPDSREFPSKKRFS